ncbi:GMC family oxidoreductase [Pseudomonas carnis]|uniref:GMC family oxidoreductase n=1 Tax=Pseudomonas carnis TaxID=2487355 RepID=A0ABT5RNZ2_9PSED|nr:MULTISPECIES: GMC family oxidoreductase [Pseudomonas]MBA1255023.1 GMC family oxidoreductase [Pseudomonas carnis]MBA1269352.1 GMC family oxidoreductase [Pseudomonas carnis]MBJ2280094.1 GMC family oxidoreductase [Pseudomonas sp. MF6767]MCP9733183.1 GMC family oxidoreductase [Pseudomonas sp. GBPI_506]MDD1947721.1 GMC family oxidoreductase [Pseudomonas carnis]
MSTLNTQNIETADVIVVGAGMAGSVMAYQLGLAGLKVLVLESGPAIPPNRSEYLERFYTAVLKAPESPYPPEQSKQTPAKQFAPRATIQDLITAGSDDKDKVQKSYLVQNGPQLFASTYERVGGGTMWHWMGTALRLLPNDFRMQTKYKVGVDWPISYDDLQTAYCRAEEEMCVSADVASQSYLGVTFPHGYQYSMHGIPPSLVDQGVGKAINDKQYQGFTLNVRQTPAGRNSQNDNGRRVCAGNTSCTPICPIQAKYDATVTMAKALDTGNVRILYQCVASKVQVDANGVTGIDFIQYQNNGTQQNGTAQGKRYVIAAHAIETPKLLLNSISPHSPNGVANSSGQVGKSLADHPVYLAWGLMPEGKPLFPFRGPLSTSGIEDMRDGPFRSERAAWRIEIGNEGWNWSANDPYTTVCDFIDGDNNGGTNNGGADHKSEALSGVALVQKLNSVLTRQFRLAFLIEQVEKDPEHAQCRVESSKHFTDGLGLPRPEIAYELSDYTKEGFKQARLAATHIITKLMGATELTDLKPKLKPGSQTVFEYDGQNYAFYGAGHLMGTYRMGSDRRYSVVDKDQRSWDHPNLFLVGDGVFPSTGTANPTLTITALTFQAADVVASDLLKRTVQVQARDPWQGTGVQVNGQSWQLAVCTGGQWTANPGTGMVGAAGHPGLTAKPGYTLPGQAEGALIGRIGTSGAPFLVGNQAQLPRGQQGELQLCINDDLAGRYGAGLSDNQGSLSVEVRFGSV